MRKISKQLCPYKMNGLSTATRKKRPLPCRLWKRAFNHTCRAHVGFERMITTDNCGCYTPEERRKKSEPISLWESVFYYRLSWRNHFSPHPKKTPRHSQPMQKGPWHVVEVRVLGLTKFSVVSDQLCMNSSFFVFNADTWLRKSVNILTNDYKELDLLPVLCIKDFAKQEKLWIYKLWNWIMSC